MKRPKLLDLFCKAGGAAEGYRRAGFDVVGVDIEHQPNYPFEFVPHGKVVMSDVVWVPNDDGYGYWRPLHYVNRVLGENIYIGYNGL